MTRRSFMGMSLAAAYGIGSRAFSEEKPTRICIIGDTARGGFGHDLHLAWALREDVAIVGLSDPDEEGRARRAKECGAQRTYGDYREMLEKEKPDLVTVCPRIPVNHKEYVLAAAACGAHGFMEKPLAVDLAEADAMVSATREKGLCWAIAFNWHMVPEIQYVLQQVKNGLIGEVLEIRARGKEDRRSGGEDMIVLGAHTFDLLRLFLGNPKWCQATVLTVGRLSEPSDIREGTEPLGPMVGDTVQAVFGFEGGVTASFSSIRNQQQKGGRWGMDILGSEGVLRIRMEGSSCVPLVRLQRGALWMPDTAAGNGWEPLAGAPETVYSHPSAGRYGPITGDLLAAIREKRPPVVGIEEGRASLEMVSAVFASHMRGKRVLFPLEERRHPLSPAAISG